MAGCDLKRETVVALHDLLLVISLAASVIMFAVLWRSPSDFIAMNAVQAGFVSASIDSSGNTFHDIRNIEDVWNLLLNVIVPNVFDLSPGKRNWADEVDIRLRLFRAPNPRNNFAKTGTVFGPFGVDDRYDYFHDTCLRADHITGHRGEYRGGGVVYLLRTPNCTSLVIGTHATMEPTTSFSQQVIDGCTLSGFPGRRHPNGSLPFHPRRTLCHQPSRALSEAASFLRELRATGWLDSPGPAATAALSLDLVFRGVWWRSNGGDGHWPLTVAVRLLAEFTPHGGVIPTASMAALNVDGGGALFSTRASLAATAVIAYYLLQAAGRSGCAARQRLRAHARRLRRRDRARRSRRLSELRRAAVSGSGRGSGSGSGSGSGRQHQQAGEGEGEKEGSCTSSEDEGEGERIEQERKRGSGSGGVAASASASASTDRLRRRRRGHPDPRHHRRTVALLGWLRAGAGPLLSLWALHEAATCGLLLWMLGYASLLSLTPWEAEVDAFGVWNAHMVAGWQISARRLTAFALFSVMLKALHYLSRYFREISVISRMLRIAASNVMHFLLVFLLYTLSAAMVFHLLFGGSVEGYETLAESYVSSLRAVFGDFNMESILSRSERSSTHENFADAALFLLYLCVSVFILLNVFVAILTDAYADGAAEARFHRGWAQYAREQAVRVSPQRLQRWVQRRLSSGQPLLPPRPSGGGGGGGSAGSNSGSGGSGGKGERRRQSLLQFQRERSRRDASLAVAALFGSAEAQDSRPLSAVVAPLVESVSEVREEDVEDRAAVDGAVVAMPSLSSILALSPSRGTDPLRGSKAAQGREVEPLPPAAGTAALNQPPPSKGAGSVQWQAQLVRASQTQHLGPPPPTGHAPDGSSRRHRLHTGPAIGSSRLGASPPVLWAGSNAVRSGARLEEEKGCERTEPAHPPVGIHDSTKRAGGGLLPLQSSTAAVLCPPSQLQRHDNGTAVGGGVPTTTLPTAATVTAPCSCSGGSGGDSSRLESLSKDVQAIDARLSELTDQMQLLLDVLLPPQERLWARVVDDALRSRGRAASGGGGDPR